MSPLLRPHVAEQVCRNRAVLRHLVLAVDIAELRAHVTMQFVVQRLDLFPEAAGFGLEFGRAHIDSWSATSRRDRYSRVPWHLR